MEMKHSIKGVLDIELKLLISIIQYFPCRRERVAMIVFYFLYLLSLRQITTTVFYFLLLKILRQQKKYCSSLSLLSLCAIPLSLAVFYFLLLGITRQQKNYCSYLSLLSHAAVSLKRRSISRFISLKLVSLKSVPLITLLCQYAEYGCFLL